MDDHAKDQERRMIEANGFKQSSTPKALAVPRPSASVLLISPNNQVLLLQRVKNTTSFASAHVFPGGNLSTYHDTTDPPSLPPPSSPDHHTDSPSYRLAAIRETFEESGILLARNNGFGRLIELSDADLLEGRQRVHGNKVPFVKWLSSKGGRADVNGLLPFTRWVTPTNVPKRFTTQMYLYFLPTLNTSPLGEEGRGSGEEGDEGVQIPVPTTDGGLEHTNARFLPASAWCRLAQEGRIILFPPQFFLLHWVAQFLDGLKVPADYASVGREVVERGEMERRRKALVKFVKGTEGEGDAVGWVDKCISPMVMPLRDGKKREDGRGVLALHNPGPELKGHGRSGVKNWCVLVDFKKEGPRRLSVVSRKEALGDGPKL